jgi:hypothetical protein
MDKGLTRMVDGVEQRLCWRFGVHGKMDATYEPARDQLGPFDPDRQRRLKRGETFRRLGRAGSPREYQGLFWRPKDTLLGLAQQ